MPLAKSNLDHSKEISAEKVSPDLPLAEADLEWETTEIGMRNDYLMKPGINAMPGRWRVRLGSSIHELKADCGCDLSIKQRLASPRVHVYIDLDRHRRIGWVHELNLKYRASLPAIIMGIDILVVVRDKSCHSS